MRPTYCLTALAAAALIGAGFPLPPAAAETSSWVQRDDEAAARQRATGARAEAKPTPGGKLLGGPNVSSHGKKTKTAPATAPAARPTAGPHSTKPATGDDDAWLAFDQGRYLTALKLAEALAQKGDASAHTLVARIHAEGLGVPLNAPLAAEWMKRAAELGDVNAAFY